ncbi:alkaline phosphatase D family protein [Cerasicoccus fimbriatus]|uniref:alkaline phosphatase D family protein n=1 Tax=Cerasicoccus fimbriatus TaxID=3014554 RepID=UPI0022B3D59E|nr:alkaline phosphatase D family protein [Cerasicoccus sp. TK19100]
MAIKPRCFFTLFLALALGLAAHAVQIASGPMVGAPEMRAMPLWVQLDGPAKVSFAYWPQGQTGERQTTTPQDATEDNAFVVESMAGPLTPGTVYEYEVLIDGRKASVDAETKFKTSPFYTDRAPPPDFTVALGSGNYVNEAAYDPLNRTPGGGYEIFLAIQAKQPDLMIWAGNSVHLREPDWGSRPGMLARYSKNRAQPELQPLLASVPQVAAVGQGEFGAPHAGKNFRNREDAQDVFQLFWANPPTVNGLDSLGTTVRYGDAEFFLLDDRSNRDVSHDLEKFRAILGKAQVDWLRQALRESTADFKVIVTGSSALSPSKSELNHKLAESERDDMLELIKGDRIGGLVFVCGGKDFGELTKMVRANAPDVYELSLGPLTARPTDSTRELNFYRVPSTSTFQRQFALMKFHGAENDRQLTVTVYNGLGDQLWTQTLALSSMQF